MCHNGVLVGSYWRSVLQCAFIMTELISFSQKLKMMNMIETGKSVTAVGRFFGVSEAAVRALKWKEHHDRSRVYGIYGGKTVAHVHDIERMEKALTLWILEQKETPTSVMIRTQAEEIFKSFKVKKTRNAMEFHATKAWYGSFKRRQTLMLEIEHSLPEKPQSGKESSTASSSSSSLLKHSNPSGMKSTKLQPIAPKPCPQTIKVTRAATMQQLPPPQPPPPEPEKEPDEVCLRWNSHHTNMKSSFPSLLEREQYVDVTLCCEGKTIRCHRLILSSCSSYFDEILSTITPLQHPVIFLKGTPFWILKSLIDFMYVGEVHIEQSKLQDILEVAEILKIKGLTGKKPQQNGEKNDDKASNESLVQSTSIPVSIPAPMMPMKVLKAMPPLRLAVNKDVDPLSLLKPTFFEEPTTLRKILPKTDLNRKQSLASEKSKAEVNPPRRILPKRRLKRKSSEPQEREASPPPLILRKGTKSRPVVKAPKYYHMEYDDPMDKQMKLEEEPREPEVTFDIVNVKSEPIDEDLDIVENEVAFGQAPPMQDDTPEAQDNDEEPEPSNQSKDHSETAMEISETSADPENLKEIDPDYCEDECNSQRAEDSSELAEAPDPQNDKGDNV